MPTKHINDSDQVAQAKGTFTALKDSDILDYPGKKDGQVVGEVIQEDEVKRLATVNGIWSQIYYKKREWKKRHWIYSYQCSGEYSSRGENRGVKGR